jgi:hypothetical protein
LSFNTWVVQNGIKLQRGPSRNGKSFCFNESNLALIITSCYFSFLRIVPMVWIVVTLEGVGGYFKIHSVAWIGLGLKIRTPRFSACKTNYYKDRIQRYHVIQIWVYFILPFYLFRFGPAEPSIYSDGIGRQQIK